MGITIRCHPELVSGSGFNPLGRGRGTVDGQRRLRQRSASSSQATICPAQSELASQNARLATEGDWPAPADWLQNRLLPKAALRPGMFLAGIATWAVLAQPCVYCFILPRASEHYFPTKSASLLLWFFFFFGGRRTVDG